MIDLNFLHENKYIYSILMILIIMYAAQIRPKLPDYIMHLFNNSIFRILILVLILINAKFDTRFSLILATAFVIISDYVTQQFITESFAETLDEYQVKKFDCPSYEKLLEKEEKNFINKTVECDKYRNDEFIYEGCKTGVKLLKERIDDMRKTLFSACK